MMSDTVVRETEAFPADGYLFGEGYERVCTAKGPNLPINTESIFPVLPPQNLK
jgi:hypothetical protein